MPSSTRHTDQHGRHEQAGPFSEYRLGPHPDRRPADDDRRGGQAQKRPVGNHIVAAQTRIAQCRPASPANGARKNAIRHACQPRNVPTIIISVTSPKPIASRRSAAVPISRTAHTIPPLATRPTSAVNKPAHALAAQAPKRRRSPPCRSPAASAAAAGELAAHAAGDQPQRERRTAPSAPNPRREREAPQPVAARADRQRRPAASPCPAPAARRRRDRRHRLQPQRSPFGPSPVRRRPH